MSAIVKEQHNEIKHRKNRCIRMKQFLNCMCANDKTLSLNILGIPCLSFIPDIKMKWIMWVILGLRDSIVGKSSSTRGSNASASCVTVWLSAVADRKSFSVKRFSGRIDTGRTSFFSLLRISDETFNECFFCFESASEKQMHRGKIGK